ncbi:uncharacterized protein LOC136037673 [Artemia franciscana]|uniref:uncharacterized protein LOC136037673 n=1 Tax=Artemia franciscana TaxID=6661 RepID=UPI0032D9C101
MLDSFEYKDIRYDNSSEFKTEREFEMDSDFVKTIDHFGCSALSCENNEISKHIIKEEKLLGEDFARINRTLYSTELENEIFSQRLESIQSRISELRSKYVSYIKTRMSLLLEGRDRILDEITNLKELEKNMLDRRSEELSVIAIEDIDWHKVVKEINIKLSQELDIDWWQNFWIKYAQPRLLYDSISKSDEEILQNLIRNSELKFSQLVKELRYKFPKKKEKWLEKQMERLTEEMEIASKKEIIDSVSDINGVLPFKYVENELYRRLEGYSYHQIRKIHSIIQNRIPKNVKGFTRIEDALLIIYFKEREMFETELEKKPNDENKPHQEASPCINRTLESAKKRYQHLKGIGHVDEYQNNKWHPEEDDRIIYALKRSYKPDSIPYARLKSSFPGKSADQVERRYRFLAYHRDAEHKETEKFNQNNKVNDDVINQIGCFNIKKFRERLQGNSYRINTKVRASLRTNLKEYCKPYFVRIGRAKSEYRNPSCSLFSKESRCGAMLLVRYLKFLEVDPCNFFTAYDKIDGNIYDFFCAYPKLDTYVPHAMIEHLVKILREGQYVERDPYEESSLKKRRLIEKIKNQGHVQNNSVLQRGSHIEEDGSHVEQSRNETDITSTKSLSDNPIENNMLEERNGDSMIKNQNLVENSLQELNNTFDKTCYHPPNVPTLLLLRSLIHHKDSLEKMMKKQESNLCQSSLGLPVTDDTPRLTPEYSQYLLTRRLQSLLYWPIRMNKEAPPSWLKSAKKSLEDEQKDVYKAGRRGGLNRTGIKRLKKSELSKRRRINMLKHCHGMDDLKSKVEEPRPKRKYTKRPKEKVEIKIRRSTRCHEN